jgi:GTP cyclohydrolase I
MKASEINKEHLKELEGQKIIKNFLSFIGEDPTRPGLIDTPKRVVKMWKEIYRGYDKEQEPRLAIFGNGTDGVLYDQMITDEGYYFSQCEHHSVTFFGQYYFAYVPNKKILGLSKVARVVDYFSAKMQIQERLTKEIVDYIEKELQPKGIALVMKGRHLCKEMRGVKKIEGKMTTTVLRGCFKDEPETRAEFMSYVNSN